jgi:hypothetical protein
MTITTVTIRGVDSDLLKQARISAIRNETSIGDWLNEAIREKLVQEKTDLPFNLDPIAEKTQTEGVFNVPVGTIQVGSDYTVDRRFICAAGRKNDEEVVTYQTPSTIASLGYKIFWIR